MISSFSGLEKCNCSSLKRKFQLSKKQSKQIRVIRSEQRKIAEKLIENGQLII